MNEVSINDILHSNKFLNKKVSISGWVKTFRANRFIALNDGSGLGNLQCVIDFEKKKTLQIILDNGDPKNSHYCEFFSSNSIISEDLFNKDELFKFIGKKSFDNRSDFQYYPFKLFQEVLINE